MNPAPPKDRQTLLKWVSICGVYMSSFAMMYVWTVMPRTLEAAAWTGSWIGALYAARKIVDSVSMWVWAGVADRSGRLTLWLKIQFTAGALALVPLLWSTNVTVIALSVLGCSVALGGALPLLDTLSIQGVGAERFGRVRLWGSAGFLCLALTGSAIGYWGDYEVLAQAARGLIVGFGALAALCAWMLPQDHPVDTDALPQALDAPVKSIWRTMGTGSFALLLGIACLHWAAQSPFNMFIVALFEQKGMPAWAPGLSVAAGVSFELVVMAKAPSFLRRYRGHHLIAVACAVGALRWGLSAWTTHVWVLIGLQVLHGLSFGLFFAAVVSMVHNNVPKGRQAQAQAALYLVMFALGSLIGNACSGVGLEHHGAASIYWGAALLEALLVPAVLAWGHTVGAPMTRVSDPA